MLLKRRFRRSILKHKSTQQIIIFGLLLLIILFIIIPVIYHNSATIQRHLVFLPWDLPEFAVKWPKNVDFDLPEKEGLRGTRNFYLETDLGVQVGVWHILPKSVIDSSPNETISEKSFETHFQSGKPIFIYLHGNTGSRGRDHRIEIYKILSNLDYHVIAFDYRGYADSSPAVPTKTGVVQDAISVYKYVQSKCASSPIFIWGHSLGTAVSTQFVNDMSLTNNPPEGLILESPFNNIYDEIKLHPMSFLWRKMPLFDWLFTGNLDKNDVGFASDRLISNIEIPIIILHAEDDLVVPFQLGQKLFKTALKHRSSKAKPIQFIPFSSVHGYGHIYIYAAPELPEIVGKFVTNCLSDTWNDTRSMH
ncbi:lysophosphatidylserine lipase ABHD12 isoform X3 [Lepeophtheirus salmonis]|nr:lysophosphatidylserine lipase ABHD12-like isoform X3 [Lepeophtheirus salmonis]XP_040576191.1 lysophosphatidylserine lipase ABHD12-like isoform X3 [Lepeophtheirus salmonis]XP_040576192.1 lysophosphatidylserine lipase ABHD12-like isoform X3 [Lepeophtheirus salmonis]XP_040576193.1 lysophosphatidylserine lipase ABHD12-like isoform X3 [Lepeophtheirus salmonis]